MYQPKKAAAGAVLKPFCSVLQKLKRSQLTSKILAMEDACCRQGPFYSNFSESPGNYKTNIRLRPEKTVFLPSSACCDTGWKTRKRLRAMSLRASNGDLNGPPVDTPDPITSHSSILG